MIYLDSSVALAEIMSEARKPDAEFWTSEFVSSELLRFEIWNRLHVYGAGPYRRQKANNVLSLVSFTEMSFDALARALDPFPIPVRTLDGLHLATAHRLRERGFSVEIASYDNRLLTAATALGIPTASL